MTSTRLTTQFVAYALAAMVCVACSASQSHAQLKVIPLLGEGDFVAPGNSATKPAVTVTLGPANAKPGEEVTLAVKLAVPTGSYTYSMSPTFGGGTRIEISGTNGLQPIEAAFKPDRVPKTVYDQAFEQDIEKFYETVLWSRKFRIAANADPLQISIKGMFRGQVCNDRSCLPITERFEVSLAAGGKTASTDSAALSPGEIHPYKDAVIPARRRNKPEPITFIFELAPKNAQPGDEVTLSITAKPGKKYHIFALSQDPDMAGLPTVLKVTSHPGLEPIDRVFQPSKQFNVEKPLPEIVQRVHYGEITWTRRFKVLAATPPDGYGFDGSVRYQICRTGTCRIPMTIPFVLGRAETSLVASLPNQLAEAIGTATEIGSTETDAEAAKKKGLLPFLIAAVLAGFLALLTPCVFPMIPITVSFFLKQSEKRHHRPVRMALVYCGGIVVTFTGLGLAMSVLYKATAMQQLANQPWLNLGIAGVLIFFGLNLLGLFEIRIPSGLLTWSSGKESRGGYAGVLFMALTFTLVSFTCTFAFAGGLLVLAAKGEYFWPILGMLAFSAAFSLPFFFLALFPSFLQKLPKSGGWMNRVKVTMGIIEGAAALKFLNIADQMWNPVPLIFDYPVVMSAWVVLALATGLYLLGAFRLPHHSPAEGLSVPRLTFAVAFFGLAGYLAVGLFAPEKLSDLTFAFAPPQFEGGKGDIGPYLKHDGLRYALSFDDARQFAQNRNQPMFLDFTGVNCVNCRLMERRMKQPRNRRELEKFVRVQLYTDSVPHMKDRQLADKLKESNLRLQEHWFGDVTLPAYAVVTPDGKTVLSTFKGLERREGEFARFLADGHVKWRQWASRDRKTAESSPVTSVR